MVREDIPEDSELRRAWNELALRMERPEVFYTYEWAVAVQRAYGGTLKPLLFLAYEGESLVGLVALAQEKTGSRVAFLRQIPGIIVISSVSRAGGASLWKLFCPS